MTEVPVAEQIAKLFPEPFPKNSLGLTRGSVIEAVSELIEEQLGLKPGQKMIVGFDGEYVSFMHFTWSIEQLEDEINAGYWKITGEIINPLEFKTFDDALKFLMQIEPRRIKKRPA